MYGYVVPPAGALTKEDNALFTSFYCGLCIRTGKLLGQYARFATNYDITFFNILIHDLLSQDVDFKASRCLISPKKRPVVQSELLDKIVFFNVILSYRKAVDGVRDGEGSKYKMIMRSLRRAYNKSKAALPKVDEIVTSKYDLLTEYESIGAVGLDRVSDAFASMMRDSGEQLLGGKANEYSLGLIYNVAKFVYLIDALDDLEEDFKAKRYNPFLVNMPFDKPDRQAYFSRYGQDIEFILNVTINRAIECFNSLPFTQSYDLLRKTVHIGLRQKAEELLSSTKKLNRPTIKVGKE